MLPQCAAVSTQLLSTRTPAQWNWKPLKRETCQGCEPRAHGAPEAARSTSVSFLGSSTTPAAGEGKGVEAGPELGLGPPLGPQPEPGRPGVRAGNWGSCRNRMELVEKNGEKAEGGWTARSGARRRSGTRLGHQGAGVESAGGNSAA